MIGELTFAAVFLAGFFGGTHCLGMCGAIVVLYEHEATHTLSPWLRRILYNLGRLLFYMLLGFVAGLAGEALIATAETRNILMAFRILAGFLVIGIGLNLLFSWKVTAFMERAGGSLWRRISVLSRYVLPINTPFRALGAGFIWGALPCGLVYSSVALAATQGDGLIGAMVMLGFWLGTLPALLFAGASAAKVQALRARRGFRQFAGLTMLVIGAFGLKPLLHLIQ